MWIDQERSDKPLPSGRYAGPDSTINAQEGQHHQSNEYKSHVFDEDKSKAYDQQQAVTNAFKSSGRQFHQEKLVIEATKQEIQMRKQQDVSLPLRLLAYDTADTYYEPYHL